MKKHERGIGLIEIIVGVAIVAVSLAGIIIAFTLHFRAAVTNTERIQAQYLLEEGVEALYYLRGASWSTHIAPLSTSTLYYLVFTGATWEATTTATTTLGVFTRTFMLTDVFRRVSDDDIIASTSPDTKYFDPDIKHVSMTAVASTSEASFETYIANLFRN